MNLRDPKTDAEWQEAVNVAAAMRTIADCQMYGLITGPKINVARCDELLEEGAARGFTPQGNSTERAIAMIHAINEGIDKTNAKGKGNG